MNTPISNATSMTPLPGSNEFNRSTAESPTGIHADNGSETGIETTLEAPSLSVQELSQVVDSINDVMTRMSRALNFEVDTDSDELVVRVTDRETGELIRQIPSEDTLKLMQHIEEMNNILFETRA